MRSVQILCEEHRVLRDVLDALEMVLDRQSCDDHLDAEVALEATDWLERFADGLHQDREELGLFPRLRQRAPEHAQQLLDGLIRWHADERERLRQMREQLQGAAYGDPGSRDSFTVAARACIQLQRLHSDFEDTRILPLARAILLPGDDALILAEYERIERRHLQPGECTPIERARRLSALAARGADEPTLATCPTSCP